MPFHTVSHRYRQRAELLEQKEALQRERDELRATEEETGAARRQLAQLERNLQVDTASVCHGTSRDVTPLDVTVRNVRPA